MAPTEQNAAAVKLPASADFNAIYNKIALADASRASFLKNMRAKHASLARTTAAAASSSPKTAGPNGAFSSMAKPPAGVSSSQPSNQQQQRTRADDSDVRFENPSAGVGYSAPKSEEQTSAATRDLGRRLLGRRGPAQTVQKRRIQEDESEEEEGRTGLGRKKKSKRARTEEEEDGEQDAPPPAERSADTKTHAGESAQAVPGTEAEVSIPEEQDRSKNDDAPTRQDTRPETGEVKKKKKRKSKKKTGGSA